MMSKAVHCPPPSRWCKALTTIDRTAFSFLTSLFQCCRNSEGAPKHPMEFICSTRIRNIWQDDYYFYFYEHCQYEVFIKWESSAELLQKVLALPVQYLLKELVLNCTGAEQRCRTWWAGCLLPCAGSIFPALVGCSAVRGIELNCYNFSKSFSIVYCTCQMYFCEKWEPSRPFRHFLEKINQFQFQIWNFKKAKGSVLIA